MISVLLFFTFTITGTKMLCNPSSWIQTPPFHSFGNLFSPRFFQGLWFQPIGYGEEMFGWSIKYDFGSPLLSSRGIKYYKKFRFIKPGRLTSFTTTIKAMNDAIHQGADTMCFDSGSGNFAQISRSANSLSNLPVSLKRQPREGISSDSLKKKTAGGCITNNVELMTGYSFKINYGHN